jgi:hypothetical protein
MPPAKAREQLRRRRDSRRGRHFLVGPIRLRKLGPRTVTISSGALRLQDPRRPEAGRGCDRSSDASAGARWPQRADTTSRLVPKDRTTGRRGRFGTRRPEASGFMRGSRDLDADRRQHSRRPSPFYLPKWTPSAGASYSPESRTSSAHRVFRDGETRTRTGDTTIFSRAAVSSESRRFAGHFDGSEDITRFRPFPHFAAVCRTLRQTAVAVCLFVGRDYSLAPTAELSA